MTNVISNTYLCRPELTAHTLTPHTSPLTITITITITLEFPAS